LARQDVLPGAMERNRESVPQEMLDLAALAPAQQAILFAPETSGGMLVFLAPNDARAYVAALAAAGIEGRIIGHVSATCPGGRVVAHTRHLSDWQPLVAAAAEPSVCCAQEPVKGGLSSPVVASPPDALPAPASSEAFKAYMAAVSAPGALGMKQKKLINLALSVVSKCEPCVSINAKAAREAGASDAEMAEAVAQAIAFGGAPVAMFYHTLRARAGKV
jgi:AhpD family alkylhydroperoxidase